MITADEFDLLPLEATQSHELLGGRMVPVGLTTPWHSDATVSLIASLRTVVRGGGRVWSRTSFALGQNRFQPDVAVFIDQRWKQYTTRVPVPIAPDIVGEVVSANVTAHNIEAKRQAYLRNGVKEVWLAYPTEFTVLVSTPEGGRVIEDGELTTPLLPGWSLPLSDIFSLSSELQAFFGVDQCLR